jgi:tetratricopeptide (TPR) repeat protein
VLVKRVAAIPLLVSSLLLGGCRTDGTAVELPRPDLSTLPAAARDELSQRRATLDELLVRPDATETERVAAYGQLGRLYRAWGLDAAARACFENAMRLAPGDFRWAHHLGLIERDEGRLDDAAERFRRVVELQPDYLPARVWLGEIALTGGDPETARVEYERVLEEQPEIAAAHEGLGRAGLAAGDFALAAEQFEAALETQPGASRVRRALAQAYRELGRTDAAQRELERAGRVDVVLPDPLADDLVELRGGVGPLLREGDRALAHGADEQAIAFYRQALGVEDRTRARLALGEALYRSGDLTGALAQYVNAARLLPDDPHPRFMIAEIVAVGGDLEQADLQYQAVLALDREHVGALLGLSRLLRDTERAEEAEAGYRRVLQLDPLNRAAQVELPLLLAASGRVGEAMAALRRFAEEDPTSAELRLALGQLHAKSGDDEAALGEYRAALERAAELDGPSSANVHAAIGALHARRGDSGAAVGAFENAVEADPSRLDLRVRLSELLVIEGRYVRAVESYEAVLQRDPRLLSARLGQSLALLQSEEYRRAVTVLEEGLDLEPDDLVLGNALARLLATAPDPEIRDGERALGIARRVFDASRSPQHAETVAMAYAELGDFEEAINWQHALMTQAASGGGSQELVRRLRATLEGYRRGEPVRSPWKRSAS